MVTTEFPIQKVVGCRFESTEGHTVLRGIIEDAVVMEGVLQFIMRGIEYEQPCGSGQWSSSSDPMAFAVDSIESWYVNGEGNIQVIVPYIGSFTIFTP